MAITETLIQTVVTIVIKDGIAAETHALEYVSLEDDKGNITDTSRHIDDVDMAVILALLPTDAGDQAELGRLRTDVALQRQLKEDATFRGDQAEAETELSKGKNKGIHEQKDQISAELLTTKAELVIVKDELKVLKDKTPK